MRIQAFLTAAAINLKRLAAALLVAIVAIWLSTPGDSRTSNPAKLYPA